MPQLNPEFFLSQIFWLTTTFMFLLVFLWKVSLPRISEAIEKRASKINDDVETARKVQREVEKLQNEIEKTIREAHINAKEEVKTSLENIKKQAEKKILILDKEIDEKLNNVSHKIETEKKEALKDMQDQVNKLTSASVEKLTGLKVEDRSVQDTLDKLNNKDKGVMI
ncbi:MAG: ATP synthase subunit b [Alphaproteobacteria bacterium MarineAlpha5_Bin11]|nr:MAG: ATP synthase subunit b [Alphaproteobacteria bacterium MarineAlpha5_Bin11]PPR52217.1 MAG: ATP synthase subunit b [Alphaproteobacteria bacterium MarineAlpha5_Bin10]